MKCPHCGAITERPHKIHSELVSWYAGQLQLKFGSDPMGDFRRHRLIIWRNEWVVGKSKHTHRDLMPPRPCTLICGWWPGDEYAITVKLEEHTWRNRFRIWHCLTYWMDVPKGNRAPPIPGKGENSWDCDDDAIFGMGVGTDEVADLAAALTHFAEEIGRARIRYGGEGWRPSELPGGPVGRRLGSLS